MAPNKGIPLIAVHFFSKNVTSKNCQKRALQYRDREGDFHESLYTRTGWGLEKSVLGGQNS